MSRTSLTAALKDEAVRLGFDLVGATPAVEPPGIDRFDQWLAEGCAGQMDYLGRRAAAFRHPQHVLPGARSVLMLGLNYRTAEPLPAESGHARVSRYAWGTDYHDLIRRRLRSLVELHARLAPGAAARGVVDTAPLAERQFAQLAGLGWIGKNTMLVSRSLGSWLFLAALLSTEPLDYDEPFGRGHCGSCRACLDACPTGALTEPYRLDARRCLSYLTIELGDHIPRELRQPMGDRLFGCDACQEACPRNRRTPTSAEEGFRPAPGMNPIEPAGLLGLDDDAFRRRFRHTPLWRARRRGVLRNAAIVLGNGPDRAALPAVIRGLEDPEPLVRGACVWALGRRGEPAAREALGNRLAREHDPAVRDEIVVALREPA